MFHYSPVSYSYAPAPISTNPRGRYIHSLAEVRAAEANYLAAEARQREEEALVRRLEEIQLWKQEEVLRTPYQFHVAPCTPELDAYKAMYGSNYLAAYQRDHVHASALAEHRACNARLERCPYDEFASSFYPRANANASLHSRKSGYPPFLGASPRASQKSHDTSLDRAALVNRLMGVAPPALKTNFCSVASRLSRPRPVGHHDVKEHCQRADEPHRTSGLSFKPSQPAHSSIPQANEAEMPTQFTELFRVNNNSDGQVPQPLRPAMTTQAPNPAVHMKVSTPVPDIPSEGQDDTSPAPSIASSADIASSFHKIRAIEESFNALKDNFSLPTELDFLSPTSAPSTPASSDSESSNATGHLTYSPRNRSVRTYENALTVLLTQLDSVESLGDAAVRTIRKEVVGRVEKALEELERELEGRWRIRVSESEAEVESAAPEPQPSQDMDDYLPASPQQVKFDEKVYLISAPFLSEYTTEHSSTTSKSDDTVPTMEPSPDNENTPAVEAESPLEEPTAMIDIPTLHIESAPSDLVADADEATAAPAAAAADIPTETAAAFEPSVIPPALLPATHDSITASPEVSSVPDAKADPEPSTVISDGAIPSMPTLPSVELAASPIDVATDSDAADAGFLLTSPSPSNGAFVTRPNVQVEDAEDDWLEVDA